MFPANRSKLWWIRRRSGGALGMPLACCSTWADSSAPSSPHHLRHSCPDWPCRPRTGGHALERSLGFEIAQVIYLAQAQAVQNWGISRGLGAQGQRGDAAGGVGVGEVDDGFPAQRWVKLVGDVFQLLLPAYRHRVPMFTLLPISTKSRISGCS